ncbi:glycosyltransferase family 2 protein [Winogradskyella thalassocola]|uniref:Glycosyltransferase, catalytic subunit of cellulose synthase and poly-beta-1,6-N-acetylglucosamine synthase n=1 Tax=Winogradskyella thalassocola TaxID=262004 RepID=A0A1G7Y277_9FLAO|nr:glycosyltransferase [Winogradskyella thalassocola]SDG90602.1 Glycosyltransferase, catalytic subunit of cellulose synthase and poly-beta-1,6-N-acetylglucosamine synthase [Winogradskyella thalassocola]
MIIFIIITYLFIIGWLSYGFDKVDDFRVQDLSPKTKFSVIVPFRNEAKNLPKLLDSISKLNYPKSMFEVILVDDDSEDGSASIIDRLIKDKSVDFAQLDMLVITNKRASNSPKKDAITSAIKVSKYDWIVTTDADCILPKYWLDTFDECIKLKNSNCIVAPVTYHGKMTFLNRFQTLDFLSLQGATIGGFGIKKPLMCNGANFAYLKSLFISLRGFEGNDTIASGDDVFLLEKLTAYDAESVHYLKSSNAIVTTNPAENTKNLIQQRLRWASKTSQNKNWFTKLVGLVVLLGNLVCLGLLPAVYFNIITLKIALALFIIKGCIDFLLLFKTARFFKQDNLLVSYLFSSIIYPFFCVSIVFLSFFKSYEWKNRTFKV